MVDAEHALIVTQEVTTEATDNTSLQTMAEAARDALEQPTLNVVADAGYSNGAQAEALEAQGIVAHIPANRAVNNQGEGVFFDRTSFAYDEASARLRCPAGQTLQRMHARATPELMRLRRCVVEHPFASLKYRIFEKPRFLLRALDGVRGRK